MNYVKAHTIYTSYPMDKGMVILVKLKNVRESDFKGCL